MVICCFQKQQIINQMKMLKTQGTVLLYKLYMHGFKRN